MTIPFFTGLGNFFKNTWRGLTGADTPNFYTREDFKNRLESIPRGAVIVERGSTWLGGAIRKVTGEWGNHIIGYMGQDDTIEAMPNGVKRGKLSAKLKGKTQLIVFVKQDLPGDKLAGICGYLIGALDKEYNYMGLVSNFLLEGDDGSNKTEFCSEVETRAWDSVGIKISDQHAENTSPGEILIYLINKGLKDGWIIYDTYNIKMDDVTKCNYDYIKK